ncbi:hypothetical protein H5410_056175, partial [Solanum commersonii]
TVTFQFTNFEITPTPKEISQIANLPLAGRAPFAPRTTSGKNFLQSLGFRVGPYLRRVDKGWVKLDYLFQRFDHRDSYDRFQQEFFNSRVGWERHRAIVFVMAFLGIMIFYKEKALCRHQPTTYGYLHKYFDHYPSALEDMITLREVTCCYKFGCWNTSIKDKQKIALKQTYTTKLEAMRRD